MRLRARQRSSFSAEQIYWNRLQLLASGHHKMYDDCTVRLSWLSSKFYYYASHHTLSQIQDIVGKYGLVVISRYGHNPEKFIYESDNLTPLKVYSIVWLQTCIIILIFLSNY